MKKILLLIVFLLLPVSVFAETQVMCTWDANAEGDVAGYKVYDNGSEIASTLVGIEEAIFVVGDGSHDFTVTCYDNFNNESIPSISVSRVYDTAAPGQPSGFRLVDNVNAP